MSLSVEIIKKRKNTTAPWEVRAIQSVIKQNFLDSPLLSRNVQGGTFLDAGAAFGDGIDEDTADTWVAETL